MTFTFILLCVHWAFLLLHTCAMKISWKVAVSHLFFSLFRLVNFLNLRVNFQIKTCLNILQVLSQNIEGNIKIFPITCILKTEKKILPEKSAEMTIYSTIFRSTSAKYQNIPERITYTSKHMVRLPNPPTIMGSCVIESEPYRASWIWRDMSWNVNL
jgi:hypothetical protein